VRPLRSHRLIVAALRKRDPAAARAAMQDHNTRAIDALLQATETEAMQRIRKRDRRQMAAAER
jgi:GntR family transcriptional repressor for pyruvate dehydrogenase complex